LYPLNYPHFKSCLVATDGSHQEDRSQVNGGKAPRHQLAPREPRPEPTEVERLRAELAEVTAARNAAQQQLEQVIHDRDQETLAV
jgi:hypothetical protein